MVGDDSVIALGGVIGTVGKTGSAESGNFSLENLNVGGISGCLARTGTKGTRINCFLLFRIVDHSFGPDAEKCSQIGLRQMDDM